MRSGEVGRCYSRGSFSDMAGEYKVFQFGPLEHARKYFLPYADTFLPIWSLWGIGVLIPFIELVAGALVMFGLRIREALVFAGVRVSYCDFRAPPERTALRVSYTRYTPACAAAVYITFTTGRRPIFGRSPTNATPSESRYAT